jgi:hypothetical protein
VDARSRPRRELYRLELHAIGVARGDCDRVGTGRHRNHVEPEAKGGLAEVGAESLSVRELDC